MLLLATWLSPLGNESLVEECRERARRLASLAAIVVAAETAYDITDSLKTSPDQYPEQLYRLSRLAAKIVRDIERKLTQVQDPGRRGVLGAARRDLLGFHKELEGFLDCLGKLGDEERRRIVVEFAALAVAPDRRAYNVAEILHGSAPQAQAGGGEEA